MVFFVFKRYLYFKSARALYKPENSSWYCPYSIDGEVTWLSYFQIFWSYDNLDLCYFLMVNFCPFSLMLVVEYISADMLCFGANRDKFALYLVQIYYQNSCVQDMQLLMVLFGMNFLSNISTKFNVCFGANQVYI